MSKPAWYDVEMRGRRLEAVAKQVNTIFWNKYEDDPELALSYLDRLLKIEHALQPYIEQILGVKKFLKDTNKNERNISVPIR